MRQKEKIAGPLAVMLLSFFLILSPVAAHNIFYGKDTVFLTSHAGFNFYVGNHPGAEGVFSAPEGTGSNVEAQIEDSRAVAEREADRRLKPSEVSKYWSDKAWAFIKEEPGEFFKLCGRKLLLFFDAREISDVDDYFFGRNFNPFLKFPWLDFALLGPLFFVGLAAFGGVSRLRIPLYLWIASYLLGMMSFFVNARYRLPLLGVFFPLAAVGIFTIFEGIKKQAWGRLFIYFAVMAGGVAVTQLKLVGTNWARDYVNAGDVYQSRKEYDQAIDLYKKALEIDPNSEKASQAMGVTLTRQGRYDEAKEFYLRTIEANPNNSLAYNNLGLWYDGQGNLEEAKRNFLKAIELKPGSWQAHNNLGMVYGKMGENDKAAGEFKESLRLNASNPRAHTNLGLILYRLGKQEEAKSHWITALQINPNFEEARRALRAISFDTH